MMHFQLSTEHTKHVKPQANDFSKSWHQLTCSVNEMRLEVLGRASLYKKKKKKKGRRNAQFWSLLFKRSIALMLTASRTKEVSEQQRGRIVDMHKARKGLKNISKSLDVYQLMVRQAQLLFLGVGVLAKRILECKLKTYRYIWNMLTFQSR